MSNICSYNLKLMSGQDSDQAIAFYDDSDKLRAVLTKEIPPQWAHKFYLTWSTGSWDDFSTQLNQAHIQGVITPAGVMVFNELYRRNLHARGLQPIDPSSMASGASGSVQQHYNAIVGTSAPRTKLMFTGVTVADEHSDPDYTMWDNLPDTMQKYITYLRQPENQYQCVDGSDVDVRCEKDNGNYLLLAYFGEDFLDEHGCDPHVAAQQFLDDCKAGNWYGVVAAVEILYQATASVGGAGHAIGDEDSFRIFETYMLQGGGKVQPVHGEAQLFAGRIIKDRGFVPDEAKPDAMDITRDMIRGK